MLDNYLIGTVAKSPSMSGHNLTTKIEHCSRSLSLLLSPHSLVTLIPVSPIFSLPLPMIPFLQSSTNALSMMMTAPAE
jgi:hypothetical protein